MKDMKFDNLAESYDEGFAGKASQKFYNLLLREISLQPGAAVLDVGCGTGALLRRIAGTADITGYGVDVEENMIAQAQKQCPEMQFAIAPCDQLPFEDQSFDAVVACMAYHHFDNKAGFAQEAARVLRPGGVLYIVDPRFPWPVRKAMNGIARLFRVVGEFLTAQEMEARFVPFGFTGVGAATDAYAQVVELQKKGQA
ncbi:MAG: methyltransferase domain-containing protein [Firmicutes bacterium]|nr:methyltransferase domain-containing protein [Bacillota bacterium]